MPNSMVEEIVKNDMNTPQREIHICTEKEKTLCDSQSTGKCCATSGKITNLVHWTKQGICIEKIDYLWMCATMYRVHSTVNSIEKSQTSKFIATFWIIITVLFFEKLTNCIKQSVN